LTTINCNDIIGRIGIVGEYQEERSTAVQIWIFLGGNAVYVVGLVVIWAIMTYFAGNRVGKEVVVIIGIPLWVEILALAVAACIAAVVFVVAAMAVCAVILALCGVGWVLTLPWWYRYRRLFLEYIGFNPKMAKGLKYGSKWQRRVDRRLKEFAVALQNALDQRAAAGDGSDLWSLNNAVSQARKSFRLAQKAAHECWFSVKRSHEDYLPKKRKDKLERVRRLQIVA